MASTGSMGNVGRWLSRIGNKNWSLVDLRKEAKTVVAKLSFVLPTRDESPEVLRATLDGILATSAGHEREIVVVDDASTAPVSLEHPEVRLVRNNVSVGSAQSRRLGVAITTGDVLVVMDAHMKFAPDWI